MRRAAIAMRPRRLGGGVATWATVTVLGVVSARLLRLLIGAAALVALRVAAPPVV
jgi:hypothetical protein